MDVVVPRVHGNDVRIQVAHDRRSIRAKWGANMFGQNRFAILRTKDEMDEILSKRLRHRRIPAPLQGAHRLGRGNPGRCPGLSSTGAFSARRLRKFCGLVRIVARCTNSRSLARIAVALNEPSAVLRGRVTSSDAKSASARASSAIRQHRLHFPTGMRFRESSRIP